jgi:hypothetical protein
MSIGEVLVAAPALLAHSAAFPLYLVHYFTTMNHAVSDRRHICYILEQFLTTLTARIC